MRPFPEVTLPENLVVPYVDLEGVDGNAFAVLGTVTRALREAGNGPDVLASYREQATGGSYEHLLRVSVAFASGRPA